jgi:hypothetical protein
MLDQLDQHAATELQLFIENDEHIYTSRFVPVMRNLKRKMNRGTYDHNRAPKLWRYLVDAAAKAYDPGSAQWHKVFNTTTRQHVAQTLADEYREDIKDYQ